MLILLLPVLGVEIIVGNIFIQRHYARVTEQMSRSIGLEVALAAADVDEATDMEAVRDRLTELSVQLQLLFTIEPEAEFAPENKRHFYDLSGAELIKNLSDEVGRPVAIDLVRSETAVDIRLATNKGVLVIGVPRTRVSANNPHQLLVWMVMSSLVLIIIAALFLRNQIRPMQRLAQAAEAFGKGQNIEYRPRGSEEVRRAGHAFVAMRHRIERQMEQRKTMLSAVSHDLRTPLTRLKLSLSMQDEIDDSDEMMRDVDNMEVMLAELLAFSRDESTEDRTDEDLVILIEELVALNFKHGSQIDFVNVGSHPKHAEIRRSSVTRAIQNLLDNAAKFAETVRLTLYTSNTQIRIAVEDDGPGIPEAEREQATKPFTRLNSARTIDGKQGVGLGLAIAEECARSHGGGLELSESELGGLKVEISLPRLSL